MSQDVVINGTTYPGVESISLQDSEGNTRMYFPNAVRYVPQTLTDEQKAQARENIGAVSTDEITAAVNDGLNDAKESGEFKGDPGDDYVLTEADKDEIAAIVVEKLGGEPIFGFVDENNNIIVQGNLADGTYNVKYEMDDGSTVDIGNLVLDSNVYYTVTNKLTNCTNSNNAVQAIGGQGYTATITANSGYELKSVSVTMGGSPVTVSGGVINIAKVTGNIVITAVAEETVVAPSYTNYAKNFEVGRLKSGGTVDSTSTAATTCSDYIPFTQGTVVRVKGFGALTEYNVALYDSSKVSQSVSKANAAPGFITYAYDSASGIVTLEALSTAISLLRVSGILTGTTSDVIITVNEEIV